LEIDALEYLRGCVYWRFTPRIKRNYEDSSSEREKEIHECVYRKLNERYGEIDIDHFLNKVYNSVRKLV